MFEFNCRRAVAARSCASAWSRARRCWSSSDCDAKLRQLLDTLDVDTRLRHPARGRLGFRACGRYLQLFLRSVELKQGLATLDVAADLDEARHDLAARAKAEFALVAGADFT
jgi:hypothetical protein